MAEAEGNQTLANTEESFSVIICSAICLATNSPWPFGDAVVSSCSAVVLASLCLTAERHFAQLLAVHVSFSLTGIELGQPQGPLHWCSAVLVRDRLVVPFFLLSFPV